MFPYQLPCRFGQPIRSYFSAHISSSECESHDESDQKPYSPGDNRRAAKDEANSLPRYPLKGWIGLHVDECRAHSRFTA
jgi:hypothetical protein